MAKRILVVDDDTMNLKRTELILGKQYDEIGRASCRERV